VAVQVVVVAAGKQVLAEVEQVVIDAQ